jgi:hypothetical protein
MICCRFSRLARHAHGTFRRTARFNTALGGDYRIVSRGVVEEAT